MLKPALLAIAFIAIGTPAQAQVSHVDNATLQQLLATGASVIDIRTPREWEETGVIEGSHLRTFFDAQGNYDTLAWLSAIRSAAQPGKPLVLICQSGGRSRAASRLLAEHVHDIEIYNSRAGIAEWVAEGRPTIPLE